MLTLLSPTLPTTTGPICHQRQAGTERSDVAASVPNLRDYGITVIDYRVRISRNIQQSVDECWW